jgi:hypothetical protein
MKARQTLAMAATLGLGAVFLAPSFATAEEDHSGLSNEELAQMRTEARNMGEADQARFRTEMQKRTESMSQEERQLLRIAGPQGEGTLQRDRQRDNSGDGAGQGNGQHDRQQSRVEQGADHGRDELNRDRQRAEGQGGYGRGYESRRDRGGAASGGAGGGRQGGGGRRGG